MKLIEENLNYLADQLGIDKNFILKRPQMLSENPDAFAIKLRIIKMKLLRLKRADTFDPNKYKQLFITSPAKIVARIQYSINHGISDIQPQYFYKNDWLSFFQRFIPTINKERANNLGKQLVEQFTKRSILIKCFVAIGAYSFPRGLIN